MKIDLALLSRLEKLSHLTIEDEKKERVMRQLSDILGYIDNLNELDTEGLDAAFSTLEGGTPLREDKAVQDTETAKKILSRAPQSDEDFFIVPAIID